MQDAGHDKTAHAIIDHGRKEEATTKKRNKDIHASININGRSSTRGYVKFDKVSSMPFAKCM